MNDIVENNVKPSGAIVTPPATEPEPTTPARTLTYRLYGGGTLAVPCPAWCTSTHEHDLDGTLHPADLCHEGDEIRLSFTTSENEESNILAARITQYPFSAEGDDSERPHMALMADADSGETLGYQTAGEVYATIRRVQNHLIELRKLADKLAEAHAAVNRSIGGQGGESRPTWMSLRPDDIQTMPISYLLKAFDAGVVEVEPGETTVDGEISSCHPRDIVLLLRRDLTQPMRERAVRNLLSGHFHQHAPAAVQVQA